MATNSVKHNMLKLAKQIANKEYFGYILTVDVKGGQDFVDISAETEKQEEIAEILKKHPEFDSGEFRRMIKEIQVRNKQIGEIE